MPKLRLKVSHSHDWDVIGYRAEGCPDAAKRALALVDQALQPAPAKSIMLALAECDMVTASRHREEPDAKLRAKVFRDDLAQFPEDIVVDAFARYRRAEQWQPTVSQIRDYCWRDYGRRVCLRDALRRLI